MSEAKKLGRMVNISSLIRELEDTRGKFGETCVYIRDVSWGAVALNREAEDRAAGAGVDSSPAADEARAREERIFVTGLPMAPMPAKDWALVLAVLEDVSAGRPRSFADAEAAFQAATRMKKKHQGYLSACARVTDHANHLYAEEDAPLSVLAARELRRVLGEGYLGGPLL